MTAISIEGLAVGYGRRRVLAEVSATIQSGQVFGVLGPNGSGKTTLVRALLGMLEPLAGRILVRGQVVQSYDRRSFARLVAAAPQEAVADFPFTIGESVMLGRLAHLGPLGLEGQSDLEACEQALERTELTDLADRPIHAVSGGELRRALVARALAQDAPILVLDEPTAALDIKHQIHILDLLRDEAARGRAVVVVLHDLNLAASHCDRLLLLSEGRAVAQGTAVEVLTDRRVAEVYGVDVYVGENQLTGTRILVPFRGRR